VASFLTTFVLSSVALAAAAEVNPRVRDPISGDKLARLRAGVVADPARPVVVFLGSSRTGFAVQTLRAEERLGERGCDIRCFNLGLPAAGPVGELITLNRVLAAGIRPTLVVVEILPAMLHDSPAGQWEQAFLTGDRLSAREVSIASRFGFVREDLEDRWVKARLAPWWAYRFPLWGRIAPSWLPYQVRGDWGRASDAGGWNASIHDEVTAEEREKGEAQTRREYADRLAELAPGGGPAAALRELIATCRARGIALRLVLLPEGTLFHSLYGPGAEDRLQTLLHGLDVPVVDARTWLPDDSFSDGHHLMRPGAGAFTDRLVTDLLLPALEGGGRD
jgi:hypothetical protein